MEITFKELVTNPGKYTGNFLCTEGVYLNGFEIAALGAAVVERDGFHYLSDPVIWIEGLEPTLRNECLSSLGYQFCPALVCGRFEYGESYGHLGGYKYQIRSEK